MEYTQELGSCFRMEVIKVLPNGHIFGKPTRTTEMDYVTFLAKLNNFFSDKRKSLPYVLTGSPLYKQIVAVHCKTKKIDCDLWHRGRVLHGFKTTGGTLVKVLLIDEGEEIFAPLGKSICILGKEFEDFPIQKMECKLFGLKPLNFVTTSTELIKRGESVIWDTVAIKTLIVALKGKEVSVTVHQIDKFGLFHVEITLNDEEGKEVNINSILVERGFAVYDAPADSEDTPTSAVAMNDDDISEALELKTTSYSDKDSDTCSFQTVKSDKYPIEDHEEAQFINSEKKLCEKLHQTRLQLYTEDILSRVKGVNFVSKENQKSINDQPIGNDKRLELKEDTTKNHIVRASPGFDSDLSENGSKDILDRRGKDMICKKNIFSADHSKISTRSQEKHIPKEPKAPTVSDDDYEVFKAKVKDKKRKLMESSASVNEIPVKSDLVTSSELFKMLTKQAKTGKKIQEHQDESEWKETDDILTSGRGVSPAMSLESLHIPESILLTLGKQVFRKPTPLQAHMWPSVLRGRDVVGIGPKNSGKTLASLIPIFTQVIETKDTYSDVPYTSGPLVLVLVSSWRRVEFIWKLCKSLLYHRKRVNVHGIYSGQGDLQGQAVSLINGCDVLIATPSILNKNLSSGYTDLHRLCHLVFDDADIIVEKFTDDIKDIMRCYADSLRYTKRKESTRQLIANGSEWTKALKSLIGAYFHSPFFAFGNGLEAAMFTNVWYSVEYCLPDEKLQRLTDCLENYGGDNNTVIFAESAKAAESLCEFLEKFGVPTLLATEYCSPLELRDSMMAWHASRSSGIADYVLVTTDATCLKVRSATCVFHYDFPRNKTVLARRLSIMLDKMKAKVNEKLEVKLSSFFFITDHLVKKMPGLIKLLKRSGQSASEDLLALCRTAINMKEKEKNGNDLCESLKLFGSCGNMQHCPGRHKFFADVDHQLHLPTAGAVKVVILDVMSASHFMGRIIDFYPPKKSTKTNFDPGFYAQFQEDMQRWYSEENNRKRPILVEINQVYAARIDQNYSRIRILYVTKKDLETGVPLQVKAIGTDTAQEHLVMIEEVLLLPDHLRAVPDQAIEVIVSCVKPVDHNLDWTPMACITMEKLILGKTLEGRISLSLGKIMWVDPLVEKTKLDTIHTVTVSLNIASELISRSYGVRNSQHTKVLKALAKHINPNIEEETNDMVEDVLDGQVTMDVAEFPKGEFHDVFVSAVVNPDTFYVQLTDNPNKLVRLEDKIDAVMSVLQRNERSEFDRADHENPLKGLVKGVLCVAKYPEDKKWYRGQIVSCASADTRDVFFYDHGDDGIVSVDDIAPAWPQILELPKQAIQCKLNNVTPIGVDWTIEAADILWALTEDKLLQAKVISREVSDSNNVSYDIELYDATQEHTVNINHELVFSGQAKGSDQLIQDMFPEAVLSTQDVDCEVGYQRIPYLCLKIYKSKNDARMNLVKELQVAVERSHRYLDELRESGGLRCLCQVLTLVKDPQVQQILLKSLVQACQGNHRNLNELRSVRGLKTICDILQESNNENLLGCAVWSLENLAVTSCNKNSVRTFGGLNSLCKILEKTNNAKLKSSILVCLDVLCQENDQNCITLRQIKGLPVICKVLNKDSNSDCIESCLKCLRNLSLNSRNRDELRDLKCMQNIYEILGSNYTDKILLYGVTTLKHLASSNHINTDLMRNIGIEALLQKFVSSPKRSHFFIKKACKEVLRLIENAISPFKGADSIQIPRIQDSLKKEFDHFIGQSAHPLTRWSQEKKTVTLSMKLFDVRTSQVLLSENNFLFRAISEDDHYELNFELYGPILSDSYTKKLLGGEVLVTLVKKEKGVWPRLLAAETKVPYLSVDFDRWVDEFSSSEDEEDSCVHSDHRTPTEAELARALCDRPLEYESDPSHSNSDYSSDIDCYDRGSGLTENFLS